MEKEDRRIKKTKKAITDALAELLTQKSLKNISVREISDFADINRGTFYLHYKDVYDLAEQLQQEIFTKFNDIVEKNEPKSTTDELFPLLINLFNLLAENSKLAKVLISNNGDAAFTEKLKKVLKEKCFINAKKTLSCKDDKNFTYFYDYMISGCIGIFSSWLMNDMKETPAQMASFTEKLIVNSAISIQGLCDL